MEVVVYSTLSASPGELIVVTSADDTVNSLIAAFCTERGIPQKRYYVIRDSHQTILPCHQRLDTAQVENGDTVYLGMKENTSQCLCGCNQWWILAFVALFIGLAGIAAITATRIRGNIQPQEYAVVIDAGSSHSQIFVYKWKGNKNNGTAVVRQATTCGVHDGGINSYTDNPAAAGPSLEPCLDAAKEHIPTNKHSETPVYLGATAGMRLLEESDNVTCQQILQSVRATLAASGLLFTDPSGQARIITGEEEGSFSWVTTNYLLDIFGEFSVHKAASNEQSTRATYGALDMGGASTQITFTPEHPRQVPRQDRYNVSLYGYNYTVYTHSCLCYGQNEGYRQLHSNLVKAAGHEVDTVEDPCMPQNWSMVLSAHDVFEAPCTLGNKPNITANKNYTFVGSSNPAACYAQVQQVYNASVSVAEPPCIIDPPPLHGEYKAFSGFYYTTDYLNVSNTDTLQEFQDGVTDYCELTWEQVEVIPVLPQFEYMRWQSCFSGQFINVLLTEKYGFNESNWKTLEFLRSIDGTDVGWSLGFMLVQSNSLPASYPSQHISLPFFILMVILFVVFVCISVAFAVYALKERQRNKQNHQRLTDYESM